MIWDAMTSMWRHSSAWNVTSSFIPKELTPSSPYVDLRPLLRIELSWDYGIYKQLLAVTHPCLNFSRTFAHYNDVITSAMASQITGVSLVCPTVCSGTDQIKHQSSTSLAFVMGIHLWPTDSHHKRPVTRKMFPFDDVITAETALNYKLISNYTFKYGKYLCRKSVTLVQHFVLEVFFAPKKSCVITDQSNHQSDLRTVFLLLFIGGRRVDKKGSSLHFCIPVKLCYNRASAT